MSYSMYIGINYGEKGFSVPVLPEKIELSEGGTNKTYDVINLGEVNTIGKPKLTDISFESFFPKNKGSYVTTEKLLEPIVYIKMIKDWRDANQKIRLILTGDGIQINDLFTIENFKFREESGQVGDIHYSIEFKRYKNYVVKKVAAIHHVSGAAIPFDKDVVPERPVEKVQSKTHTVVSGDTLFFIAKRHLGDGNRWREIYNLNKDVIKIPEKIYPGQVFKLP